MLEHLLGAGMEMNDVDDVGPQASQGPLDAEADAVGGPVLHARYAVAALGGEHEIAAAMREVPSDELLGLAVARGGVDERDARIERALQQACGVALGRV